MIVLISELSEKWVETAANAHFQLIQSNFLGGLGLLSF